MCSEQAVGGPALMRRDYRRRTRGVTSAAVSHRRDPTVPQVEHPTFR